MNSFWQGFEKRALNVLKRHLANSQPAFKASLDKIRKAGKGWGKHRDEVYDMHQAAKKHIPSGGSSFLKPTLHERISGRTRYKDKPGFFSVIHRPNDGFYHQVHAIDAKGEHVGSAHFSKEETPDTWRAENLSTGAGFERQRVATKIYDSMQQEGKKIGPSSRQTSNGKAFWESRKSR